jgi:uncharacterized repeat protein (TIGR01451 family)
VTLSATAPTLKDSATLAGGSNPTGSIVFTLFYNGGTTPVDTETVGVTGNRTYTTPTGYTLPTSGTVTGIYQWDATYSGDNNNNPVSDDNAANEQVTVSAASPGISTTPNPSTGVFGGTLQDAAILTGGYHPTGSITFRLYAPGVDPTVGPATYTEDVTGVNGNGAYHTTMGFAANAAGTWHWVANYTGDSNNSSVSTGTLDEPVTIPPQADLALAKTVNDVTPNVGDTVTFTVTLSNIGPDAATNVRVTDLLPSGFTFVSETTSQGTYSSTTGLWSVGTINVGTPQTLVIQATVTSPSAQSNTATITHSDQSDPNPGNNTASVIVTPQRADLALTKTVNDPTPNVGDTVAFTMRLSDLGPNTATNVQVTDMLPAGLSFVSSTASQGTYNSATGVWTVGTVDVAGGIRSLVIQAMVASPIAQTNSATITHSDQFDPNLGNNTATATVTPQQADLALAKSVDDPTPNVGDTITYTITLDNNGPDTATNAQVTDPLPAGVSFVSAIPSQGTYNPGTGIWTVGTVDTSASRSLRIMAMVIAASPIINTATITHSDQYDPDTSNNAATTSMKPLQADLSVTKTVDDPTPNVGQTIAYTIALTDQGPDDTTGVTLQDALPVGLGFVAAFPGQGTYDPSSGIWTVGSIANGSSAVLTVQATVNSPDPTTNTASITHSDQFDPNPGNNSASTVVTPQQADLVVFKTVNDPTPNVGDTVAFTVSARNNGPDPATGVAVEDLLQAGLTFVSATTTQGTYNSRTGLWTIGSLDLSSAQTLVVQAIVASPNASTNTATITHADQYDPNTTNNTSSVVVTPQQADLALAKTVDDPTHNVGETINYTITLTDNGPDDATSVQVTDLLPAGVSFVSATPSQGIYSSSTGLWTVGSVTTTSALTLVLSGIVVSPSSTTNTATITHSDQFDPVIANNTASVVVTPQQADLALAKTVNDPTPNVGDTITYTVTLTDDGPGTATRVLVTDLLPAGLTFVSATASQGSYNSVSGRWTVGTVTTTTPQTLMIQAEVAGPDPQTNTAAISHADQYDPVTANNTASVVVTPQLANLVLSKTVDDPTPNVGDTVTFTVTLGNNGPDAATNVQVTDTMPSGLAFVSDTLSQGTFDPTTGIWSVGTVTTPTPETLQILATVLGPSAQTNTATITQSDQFDPNPGSDTASATITPQQADLALSKTVDNPAPNVGATITYTIILSDNGPDSATSVEVTDRLPSGLLCVGADATQGIYNPINGVWTVGTVVTTAPPTLRIRALVLSPVSTVNAATITHADQYDPVTSNNTATTSVSPQQADLAVTKTVNDPRPNVGQTIAYTVSLTDNGPDTATGVTVQDRLPSGLAFVSALPGQGTYDPATGIWTVGTIENGASAVLTIQATVESPDPATNVATITHSDQLDPNPNNNTASTVVTPQQTDLFVTKTVNDSVPNVGDTITFNVAVGDNGPDDATGVTVGDPLPPGLTFVSATPSEGSYDPTSGTWTVGTVPLATAQTLVIEAMVSSPNPSTNTATITHADQFDPDTSNNKASVVVTPQQADLFITKTVSDSTPNVGDTVSYLINVADAGPDNATNVQVTDMLPSGMSFVSAIPSQGTYNSSTGIWRAGTINVFASVALQIDATVASPDPQTNTVTITRSDQFDPNTANNTASIVVTPQQADLALTKTVDDLTPNVGDTITYTVTLTDNGPDNATKLKVTDVLSPGLTPISATTSAGSYNPATGVWTVGDVSTATPETLQIAARLTSPNPQTNTATITQADQYDPNPHNNTTSVTVTPQQADLALAKTVSDPTPNVGETITYTITLTDNGPDQATGVQVLDPLAPGLSFVSASASQGRYDPSTGLWTAGTIDVGTPQTLVIQATVTSARPQTNTATIAHADQHDPVTSNNTATATATPQQADLALYKTTSDPTPNVGDAVTFTVRLTNNGPDTATSVLVTDPLPAGLSFISDTTSQGTYDSTTGLWTVGTIDVGTPQTLVIQAMVTSAEMQTNTAMITHADQYDPNPANNTATAPSSPQQADLALTKTVDNSRPNVGGTVTFTVGLADLGPDDATNVIVTDSLPVGLTLVSATPSEGMYDPSTGVWSAGMVSFRSAQTLVITARVNSPSPQTNTSRITHSDQFDPNPGSNTASVVVSPQQADLALSKTADNPTPNVGDNVTFTVTLTDNGPDPVTNAQVTDLLPSGFTFVSETTSQGTYDSATGLWSVGTVDVGSPQTLVIQATVTSPDPQTNMAAITHSDQFDPVTTNNTASVVVTPQQADLALAKNVSDPFPNVGNTVTYTVTLTDLGPDPATNVEVTDRLPAGMTFVSATTSQGTYDPTTGTWRVGTVTTAFARTLLILATVASPNPQTNTAQITHADQYDPDTTNNTTTASLTPQQADLAIAKSASNGAPNVGDEISYTVSLRNNGPDVATDVQVADQLPSGVSFVSATPSQGTYNSAAGLWTVGTVNTSTMPSLVLTGIVVRAAEIINISTIIQADQFDPDTSNNSASAPETAQEADLALAKSVNDATPNVGETITYAITLSNGGPNDATAVQVRDRLPRGLSLVSATPSQGTFDPTTGIWTVGTVTTTTQETLVISAIVASPAPQINTAIIAHSDQFDPDPGNNSATVAVTPQQADVALEKVVSDPTPTVGETITYTVTLSNNGPDRATNVEVTDALPAGVSFVSATPSQGTYAPGKGLWTVGSVNVGSAQTLVIVVRVASSGSLTNSATITHADQYDPLPTNNIDGVELIAMPNPGPTPSPPTVDSLRRFGFHAQRTQFVLTFSSAIDPARAQDIRNYTLAPIGPSGHLGHKIRLVSAVYDPLTRTVAIHPAKRVYLFHHYELVVNGEAPDGLTSPSGTLLDGRGNDEPGSDYVEAFGPRILSGAYRDFPARATHKAQHSRVGRAHSATKAPRPAPHTLPSTARRGRIGATTAGGTDVHHLADRWPILLLLTPTSILLDAEADLKRQEDDRHGGKEDTTDWDWIERSTVTHTIPDPSARGKS